MSHVSTGIQWKNRLKLFIIPIPAMFSDRKIYFSTVSKQHLYQNPSDLSRRYFPIPSLPPEVAAMNKRILTLTFVVLACSTLEAGRVRKCRLLTKCRTQKACTTSCASGPTTRLWKGKDGEIREVITHWEALHRSVEADKLEVELAGVQSELETTQAEVVALRDKAAADKASFEQQIAKLKTQLGGQRKLAANQKQRAAKAEANVASLREADRKTQAILTKVQNELKQTAADRAKLTAANAQLQKDMADMTAAKDEATSAVQAAQAEIEKMKQEALESKKATVVEENAEYEDDPPKDKDAATDEPSEVANN